jgi:signal transduction histidine kinase/ActR/RegA family two-component response regulator
MAVEFARGVGALLIAREILTPAASDRLKAMLTAQPSWSAVPIVVLSSYGDLFQGKSKMDELLRALPGTTVLERPVRLATLVSVLESAIANRRRQYEVRGLLRELESAKIESDRANKTKTEFLANMSHEIRTPLAAVLGFSELALEENLDPRARATYKNSIKRNGQLLLALVNDVLDLSKIEAGKVDLENIEVPVNDLIHDVLSALQPQAAAKKLVLNSQVGPDVPDLVLTDPVRFRQIIMNVLGNAIKFTSSGTVGLSVTARDAGNTYYEMRVEISDTGLGISDGQRPRLFQAFSQADSSTTRSYGGTGLGLVLSRKLARALGGDLELISSQPGRGSNFLITLPVGKVTGTAASPETAAAVIDVRDSSVLLVEDSPDNQMLISHILQMAGVKVVTANDGIEGIERAMHDDYDVVLMDIQMPRLDGKEATRRLRRQGYTKPIVALTANALKADQESAADAGFDGYLTKPLQRKKLFEVLGRFVSKEHFHWGSA